MYLGFLSFGELWASMESGDVNIINVWSDPWLRDEPNFKIDTPLNVELTNFMVRDLFVPVCMQWDIEMLHELFQPRDVDAIIKIPLCPIATVDKVHLAL